MWFSLSTARLMVICRLTSLTVDHTVSATINSVRVASFFFGFDMTLVIQQCSIVGIRLCMDSSSAKLFGGKMLNRLSYGFAYQGRFHSLKSDHQPQLCVDFSSSWKLVMDAAIMVNHSWINEQRLRHLSINRPYYIVGLFSLPSTGHLLLCASETTSSNFYIFWCRQALSCLTAVMVVDNPFDGYPATHTYYRWIISAAITRQQSATGLISYCQQHLLDPLVVPTIGQ
ncbi:hypothetical protein O0I10_009998 [Lichtheimia ornata]|uniref:Uncharacterized protein n=1 Tax=Lichtheimia ornata TaxID=688661 RepID=A0AAD7UX75_9FUNG|nr:uncharacterized protein O0I10_009998 [Lichtheimia ornata]KAJ8654302.1 hypothetical protein O0I10_009998 [Lichtheimia ornata]